MPDGSLFRTGDVEFEAPSEVTMPGLTRCGRGAATNPAPRFDRHHGAAIDDGWRFLADAADLPVLRTQPVEDRSRSTISWNDSPDVESDRAVNPYQGCERGCIVSYVRPGHAYLGCSPGLDFETQIVFRPNVAALLERELSKPGYVAKTLMLGSNSDPYQPAERTLKLTRSVLEVLERFNHPVSIVTKSASILTDMDILRRMAAKGLVRVWVSVTTLDPALARIMEPRASSPARRLQAIAALSDAEIPAGVLAAPMIPGLNDLELEQIMNAAHRAGARRAGYTLLRLPSELREMFTAWLNEHVPGRVRRVLSLIRETRAGALNNSRFGQRFSGSGVHADLLHQRFERAERQLGFGGRDVLDATRFAVPGRQLPLP